MFERTNCIAPIVLSIIVGVALAVVFSLGFIAQTAILLWVAFGLGIATLFTTIFILAMLTDDRGSPLGVCLRHYGGCVVSGAIGTIVSTLAGLAITLSTTGTVSIVIFFLVGAFLTLMLVSLTKFIFCTIRETYCK